MEIRVPASDALLDVPRVVQHWIDAHVLEHDHRGAALDNTEEDVVRVCFRGRKVNLSHVFAGQSVGVTQVGERTWLVTFRHYDVGYFDDEACRLVPIGNPFGPKVLPLRSE